MRNRDTVIGALCDAIVKEAAGWMYTDGQRSAEDPRIIIDQEPLPKGRVLSYRAEPASLFVVDAVFELHNRMTEEDEEVSVRVIGAATDGDAFPLMKMEVD